MESMYTVFDSVKNEVSMGKGSAAAGLKSAFKAAV